MNVSVLDEELVDIGPSGVAKLGFSAVMVRDTVSVVVESWDEEVIVLPVVVGIEVVVVGIVVLVCDVVVVCVLVVVLVVRVEVEGMLVVEVVTTLLLVTTTMCISEGLKVG